MAEPTERELELARSRYSPSSKQCQTHAEDLASYREKLQEQHRRELADAEQAGYERGRELSVRAARLEESEAMSENDKALTLREIQLAHPWNVLSEGYGAVPYSRGVRRAEIEPNGVPHIQGTHAALHAMKTLGKIAAVFEAADHNDEGLRPHHREELRKMAADLVTEAVRLAHLYRFDLQDAVEDRAEEKNGVSIRSLIKGSTNG